MEDLYDVSVVDPVDIDLSLFEAWVDGVSEDEAYGRRLQKTLQTQADMELCNDELFTRKWLEREVRREVSQQYSLFKALEPILEEPRCELMRQSTFQLSASLIDALLERYYSLDELVVRELVGKKLNQKLRKDLDDVSEKTLAKLDSCRRQFDNVKRILRALRENTDESQAMVDFIHDRFMISRDLADLYASVCFLCYHRLECGRKRVSAFTFDELRVFSSSLRANWTGSGEALFIDPNFLARLQDLRALVYNDKDVLETCKRRMTSFLNEAGGIPSRKLSSINVHFMQTFRSVVSIASSLAFPNELRDFFIDAVEKVGEALRKSDLTEAEAEIYFQSLSKAGEDVIEAIPKPEAGRDVVDGWKHFVSALSSCLLHIYHKL